MKVILQEKIRNLGELGDTVDVKSGYGRNYLIPTGRAVPATKNNIAIFDSRRAGLEEKAHEKLLAAQKRAEALQGSAIRIAMRTMDEGRLYGSVSSVELVRAIQSSCKVAVTKQEIELPNGPLREIGEFEIVLTLHPDVSLTVKVQVVPEEA